MPSRGFLKFAFEFYMGKEESLLPSSQALLARYEDWKPQAFTSVSGVYNQVEGLKTLRRDVPRLARGGISALPVLWRIHSAKSPYRYFQSSSTSSPAP